MKSAQGLVVAVLFGAALAGILIWAFGGNEDPRPREDGASRGKERVASQSGVSKSGASSKTDGSQGQPTSGTAKDTGDATTSSAKTATGTAATSDLPRLPVFVGSRSGGRSAIPPASSQSDSSGGVGEPVEKSAPTTVTDGSGGPSSAGSVAVASYRDLITRAEKLLDSGDTGGGASLLRGVFTQASHRGDLDLSPQVARLLTIEDDELWRGKYIDYLSARGTGSAAFAGQLTRASAVVAGEKESDLRKAWMELSRAHELAGNAEQRNEVYGVLGPLLEKHVFSGRFSPLIESYTVKPGDNLSKIARKYRTTVDAVRRLSGLKSDVIQPRNRLRIVPGRVEVFVDKSDFLLWVKVDDKVLLQRSVGLGKENRTPTGTFVVEIRQKDPTWYPPGEPPIPASDPRNVLGTRWIGFKDTEDVTGIGIHGTRDRGSIGKEVSNGCVRMINEDVELVFDFVPAGAKVTIVD